MSCRVLFWFGTEVCYAGGMRKKMLSLLMLTLWLGIFALVGSGYQPSLARLFGVSIVMTVLVVELLLGRKPVIPKLMGGYLAFVGLFFLSLWWSFDQRNSFDHWMLFASMPLVWLLAYHHRGYVKRYFFAGMIALGLIFLAGTIYSRLTSETALKVTPRGMMGAYWTGADHFMVGDFWSVLLVMLFYRYIKRKNRWLLPLMVVGLGVVTFSLSRSAMVGLIAAMMVWFANDVSFRAWRKWVWGVIGLIFVYMATQKSLLFNRPYYLQAILGLFAHPWGVGVGNFEIISSNERFHVFGLDGFSKVTHSILLEFLAGMGVLVAGWWAWCLSVYREYLAGMKINEYSLALVALIADMVFNPTYFVTAMWWLFGILLAILGSEERKSVLARLSGWMMVFYGLVMLVGGVWVLV